MKPVVHLSWISSDVAGHILFDSYNYLLETNQAQIYVEN